MTSLHYLQSYSPLWVLLLGVLTYCGFSGTGIFLLRIARVEVPKPWFWVAALLLGIQAGSLAVQVVAMAGLATKAVLVTIWFLMLLTAFIFLPRHLWPFTKPVSWIENRNTWIVLVPVLIAMVTNLIAALAPSTKIDELYYHMLFPARIVQDQGLVFYRYPLESASLPHMIYQAALTPLHAMGYRDAGNVVSYGIHVSGIAFAWTLIRRNSSSGNWAWLWVAPLCIGMYPVIWQITCGAFAMGDLATMAAVLALFTRRDLLKQMTVRQYALVFSIFVIGSVTSKISLAPLGILLLAVNLFLLLRETKGVMEKIWIVTCLLVPWLVLYLPGFTWNWVASGSPYGPFLTGIWGKSTVYDLPVVRHQLTQMRIENLPTLFNAVKATIIDYSVLMWGGILLFFMSKSIPAGRKTLVFTIILLQTIVVTGFLIFDLRYYGGIMQAVMVLAALSTDAHIRERTAGSRFILGYLTFFFLLPWLVLQVFYTTRFTGIVTGSQKTIKFFRQNTAFFDDYRVMDQLLPQDAVILFNGPVRLNSVYAPRPVYFSLEDLPKGKKVYLMIVNGRIRAGSRVGRFFTDTLVYENQSAVTEVFRIPGVPNKTRRLKIFSLVPAD